jgi:hypothetical protein
MEKVSLMAKESIVENLRAVYGNSEADKLRYSAAATLVEMLVTDERGNQHVLDPICTRRD